MLNMKRRLKKMAGSLLAAGLLVTGLSAGATAFAANTGLGAAGALTDSDYTLEEMLVFAIEDEHLAQTEYDAIMDSFGVQKPFSNIIKAETTHISLLTPLLEEYGVSVPNKDWESLVTAPESLDAAYEAGIAAEENNIAMYENFLKKDIPDDVREVFTLLLNASEKHLAAFQRQADATCNVAVDGNRMGGHLGRANGSTGGYGQGNRNSLQGNCLSD